MSYSAEASIVINADIGKIWDGLTKPELVKQYFFGTNMVTTWEVGSPILFKGEWDGKSYEDKGTVMSYEPLKTLSYDYYSAMSGDADVPENHALLTYKVEKLEDGDGVLVTIAQSNVATEEKAEHSKKNWEMVLEGFKKFIEAQ